jgi:hypothetical protein
MPTGATVLRLVFPMTDDGYYADLDDTTTEQAIETILDILENQEEGIALLGTQEWMEARSKKDNHCTLLSDIGNIDQDQIINYFQQGFNKVGGTTKEVWHFAIAGSADISNLLKLAKDIDTTRAPHLQKHIFSFIQHSWSRGCKIICQPTIT